MYSPFKEYTNIIAILLLCKPALHIFYYLFIQRKYKPFWIFFIKRGELDIYSALWTLKSWVVFNKIRHFCTSALSCKKNTTLLHLLSLFSLGVLLFDFSIWDCFNLETHIVPLFLYNAEVVTNIKNFMLVLCVICNFY